MKKLKRISQWLAIGTIALAVASISATWLQQRQRHADASGEAIAATASDASLAIEQGQFLVLRPRGRPERMGVIVYPGAYVDIRGYVPTLRPIAAAGYRVVVVPMPFELAIFGINSALDVEAANPDIKRWAIIGHSVGGAMAALFAGRHVDATEGLIIWDSYPPSAAHLGDFPKPVWLIHRATPNGEPPASFSNNRYLFPRDSHWVPIPGGIHMYFGSFVGGGYVEDWAPNIDRAQQRRLVVAATIQALAQIDALSLATRVAQ